MFCLLCYVIHLNNYRIEILSIKLYILKFNDILYRVIVCIKRFLVEQPTTFAFRHYSKSNIMDYNGPKQSALDT